MIACDILIACCALKQRWGILDNETYTKCFVTPKAERSARNGHPWVFADEVVKIEGKYENGDLVDVLNGKGKTSRPVH